MPILPDYADDFIDQVMVRTLTDILNDLAQNDGFAPAHRGAIGRKIKPHNVLDDHAYVLGQFSLIHSEVSEAVEAYRRGDGPDDKLPHRRGVEVELADVVIRCIKLAHHWDLDLAGAIVEKEAFNRTRTDHTTEERQKPGGKRF